MEYLWLNNIIGINITKELRKLILNELEKKIIFQFNNDILVINMYDKKYVLGIIKKIENIYCIKLPLPKEVGDF